MTLIQITNKIEPNLIRATDDLFDLNYMNMQIDDVCLRAIKEIDKAVPAKLMDAIPKYFETPFGSARYTELSTGVKCILLILHQIKHPELKWIINYDSAGPNAKSFLTRYVQTLNMDKLPFKLYCTVFDMLDADCEIPCYISDDTEKPIRLNQFMEVYRDDDEYSSL